MVWCSNWFALGVLWTGWGCFFFGGGQAHVSVAPVNSAKLEVQDGFVWSGLRWLTAHWLTLKPGRRSEVRSQHSGWSQWRQRLKPPSLRGGSVWQICRCCHDWHRAVLIVPVNATQLWSLISVYWSGVGDFPVSPSPNVFRWRDGGSEVPLSTLPGVLPSVVLSLGLLRAEGGFSISKTCPCCNVCKLHLRCTGCAPWLLNDNHQVLLPKTFQNARNSFLWAQFHSCLHHWIF